ncbi:MAG: family 20 glycosylhydrolase, partial [Phycisphaerae bacterium]
RGGNAGELVLPGMIIDDYPRFAWRGLMLDVSRHFFTAEQVCRFLDLMALHKFNIFHWHLTDDQGWRLPVERYPRLTEIGAWRTDTLIGHNETRPRHYDQKRYGGHYTRQDIQRVVAHAASLHLTVVPEIDMPGHMQAAIAAYPELGNDMGPVAVRCHWGISHHILNPQESTVQFMQNVLREVMELFPGKFIHVGGDEAHKHEWTESRAAQQRMIELGLKNEAEMQSWFIGRMAKFLAEQGRHLIGWDEILEGGLPPGCAVMSWRGVEGGVKAAGANCDVVMTPQSHTYFDYYQAGPENQPLAIGGMTTVEKVYCFDPIPSGLAAEHHHHVLGGQGQLWSEYIGDMDYLEYMAFPRACALAETLWSQAASRDWNGFLTRLHQHRWLLDRYQVRYGPIPS